MRRCISISFLIFALIICGAISIYAFLANELTKVDVSGPDPDGPVIVPENYQNLLVLNVTIPPFDADPAVQDIKLHNGVAGSSPRDILLLFDPTNWYSDHDGDASFDGNQVSGSAEAIVSSSDDVLDSGDTVMKTGLCLIELFDYSGGIGEQYVDSNHSNEYDDGEAVARTTTSAGEIYPGEVVRSGAADMTRFPSNIRFTDGINGNLTPAQYHDGEAVISSSDDILDSGDTVLIPGTADLTSFPDNVLYLDFNGNGIYGSAEAIIADGGTLGQLDAGSLDGTGVDTVIRAGTADLRQMNAEGLLFADDNGDNEYTSGELIVASADLNVDIGEVKLSGSANLKPMTGLSFADDNNNGQLNASELIVRNTGAYDNVLEAADTVVSAGNADLRAFTDEKFIDNNGSGIYDDGECIIQDGDGDDNLLSDLDTILRPGLAFFTAFDANTKWADVNGNSQYNDEELIVNSPDNTLNPGEVVKFGYCNLESISSGTGGQVYSDNDNSGTCSGDELVILSGDKILDAGDSVVTPGAACLVFLRDSPSRLRYIDADGGMDFDSGEAIVYDRVGIIDRILDDGDGIARSGPADIKSFADEVVYVDHDGDGDFQGDSDNNVNWDEEDDDTWANDPDVFNDQDEAVLTDPTGPNHLALDSADTVLRPGLALLTAFSNNDTYTDDGDGEYDGDTSNEAIVRDNNTNLILEATDVIIVSGTALIRDFDPPTSERYIDANNDGSYTPGEATIIDGGISGVLDAGALDDTGTDQVVISGAANLTRFSRAEKFVDGGGNGTYDADEAVVYDWYKPYEPYQFEGEFILAGDAASNPPNGSLAYQSPGVRTHDSILLASGSGNAAMIELNDDSNYWYADNNHSGDYDGFYYTGGYELILWSANDQLEEGNLDGTGVDRVLAAGYACMRRWMGQAEDMAWADDDHDGEYQSNEAIVDDADADGIITSIGTGTGDDRIVVSGAADLNDFPDMKYVDANGNSVFDEGELKVNDANQDDMIQNGEIEEPGPVPFLLPFVSASDDYKYCDSDGDSTFDPEEAIIADLPTLGVLEAGDQIVTTGAIVPQSFNAATDRYADSDHDNQYDYNTVTGFGEAIIRDTLGHPDVVEAGEIESDGYADLQAFNGTGYKYSDANRNDEYTDGELIINDDGDGNVEAGEIVRSGLANLKGFATDVMYLDDDGDDVYSALEAIIRTGNTVLGSDDEVLASGIVGFHSFEVSTYRFADADHDDMYDGGEAIVVEAGWGVVDDVLEDSDVVLLEGSADVEQFPASFMFLDDGANSNAYEAGESIINDSNGNDLLDPGEIITGGRAALRSFSGGERYTDGGNGANARNSQYDPDEAIIRDGNFNGELDRGALNGVGNDAVLTAGKAGFTHFADDERYVDANSSGEYDGGGDSEDIYKDVDGNGIVTTGDDALDYFVVENSGTAASADLSAVRLWADRDNDGQFEPDTDDAPAVVSLIPDASNPKMWYEGPATAPPLSSPSSRAFINYTVPTGGQRFFVTVDTSSAPTDGRDIQMELPLNGVKTAFGSPGPSDLAVTNAYAQEIDYANPYAVAVTSPTSNAVVYGLITLQAEASDTVQIGKVEFYNSPPGGGNTPIAVDDDGTPWDASWDASTLSYGSHTLYARAYDRTYLRPSQTWIIDHYTDSPGIPITVAVSSIVELVEGWNLISISVDAFNSNIDSVLSSIDYTEAWAYDATASRWLRYDRTDPEAAFLNDLDAIQAGVGYWILMSAPDTLTVNGAMPETVIQLQAGWNLVGCNSQTSLNIVDATSSIAGDFEVWTFDPVGDEWLYYDPKDPASDLNTIEPGKGYWIYTTENGVWDVGSQ